MSRRERAEQRWRPWDEEPEPVERRSGRPGAGWSDGLAWTGSAPAPGIARADVSAITWQAWDYGGRRRCSGEARWYGHRHHHGPWLPFFLFFAFLAFGSGPLLMMAGMLLFTLLVVALVAGGALLAGYVLMPAAQQLVAALTGRASRQLIPRSAGSTVSLPRYGAAPAVVAGADAYRRRLLDVLKERYVRGEITLAEFERRAGEVARDPSVRHLG